MTDPLTAPCVPGKPSHPVAPAVTPDEAATDTSALRPNPSRTRVRPNPNRICTETTGPTLPRLRSGAPTARDCSPAASCAPRRYNWSPGRAMADWEGVWGSTPAPSRGRGHPLSMGAALRRWDRRGLDLIQQAGRAHPARPRRTAAHLHPLPRLSGESGRPRESRSLRAARTSSGPMLGQPDPVHRLHLYQNRSRARSRRSWPNLRQLGDLTLAENALEGCVPRALGLCPSRPRGALAQPAPCPPRRLPYDSLRSHRRGHGVTADSGRSRRTYEALRDGTATCGTPATPRLPRGDLLALLLVEWHKSADCFVRYQVTAERTTGNHPMTPRLHRAAAGRSPSKPPAA